jgi:hypothetical protein
LVKHTPSEFLGLDCEPTALLIVESHLATADLLPKNSVLLQKVLDDVLLMLVHPSSYGNNDKLKWVQNRAHPPRVSPGCQVTPP